MPKIVNHTDQTIVTLSQHEIPAKGSLDVEDGDLELMSKHPYFMRHVRAGTLTIEALPVAEVELTRPFIAKAARGALVQIILDHSDYTAEDLSGVTVEGKVGEDGLRDMAARLVFGDEG